MTRDQAGILAFRLIAVFNVGLFVSFVMLREWHGVAVAILLIAMPIWSLRSMGASKPLSLPFLGGIGAVVLAGGMIQLGRGSTVDGIPFLAFGGLMLIGTATVVLWGRLRS